MTFDSEFSVDKHNLEVEAARQSSLMRKYTKARARYRSIIAREKRKLRVIEATLSEEYRANKKLYGIQKDTDKVIFRLIEDDPKYIAQFEILTTAQIRYDNADSAVESLIQKNYMIKELVKLWLNNYYAQPMVRVEEIKPQRIRLGG